MPPEIIDTIDDSTIKKIDPVMIRVRYISTKSDKSCAYFLLALDS